MKKGRLAFMLLTSLLAVPACGEQTPAVVAKVTISQAEASMVVGDTLQLTAEATTGELQWLSSDNEVATVANGLVTAASAGEATITAKIKGTTAQAQCKVTVTVPVEDCFIKEDTEIHIKTTFNDTYGAIWTDAIASLKKKEPHLTVTYEKYTGSYNDLKDDVVNGVPAGNYPDIVVAYPDSVADFITNSIQLNMEPYMRNEYYGWTDEEYYDFYEAYLDEGRHYSIDGTYSLPIAKSTEAMYYDAEKILGITLPGINNDNPLTEAYINNLTWEELLDRLCPALLAYRETLPENERKSFLDQETYSDWAVVGYDSDDNLFITLAEQYGYAYTSVNPDTGNGSADFVNDGMKNLMRKFNEAYKNKYFTTKGAINTNVNNRSTKDAMIFSIGSTGGVGYQFSKENPKNMKVAPIPHAEGKELKMILQGPSVAILNHKDENRALGAWLFYKELTEIRSQIAWSTTTGYSPIRENVATSDDYLYYCNDERFDEKTADHLKALNAQYVIEYTSTFFSSPVFKGSSAARTNVGGLMTKCMVDENLEANINQYFLDAYNNTIMKM